MRMPLLAHCRRKHQTLILSLLTLLSLTLSGCIPGLLENAVQPPRFALSPHEGVSIVSAPLNIVVNAEVVVRVPLEVYNPNPFDLGIRRIDFDFYLNRSRVVTADFNRPFGVPAQGNHRINLDIHIPILNTLNIIDGVVGIIEGRRTPFAVVGTAEFGAFDIFTLTVRAPLAEGYIN